jgi:hypothetical protein
MTKQRDLEKTPVWVNVVLVIIAIAIVIVAYITND